MDKFSATMARRMNKAQLAQGLNEMSHELSLLVDQVAQDAAGECYDKIRANEIEHIYVGIGRCIREMRRYLKLLDLYRGDYESGNRKSRDQAE